MEGFLSAHALAFLLLLGTAFTVFWLFALRFRLNLRFPGVLLLGIAHTLLGVAAVKVFAFLETGFSADSVGNMSLFGGVFFLPLFYWAVAKLTKAPAKDVFDAFTPCIVFTLFCARINCVLSGCCLGLHIPGTALRYPAREAELLFYAVLLPCLCPRILKGRARGTAFPIYMLSYGVFRFVIEFFRVADPQTLFHPGHGWAILSAAIGAAVFFEIKSRGEKPRGGER